MKQTHHTWCQVSTLFHIIGPLVYIRWILRPEHQQYGALMPYFVSLDKLLSKQSSCWWFETCSSAMMTLRWISYFSETTMALDPHSTTESTGIIHVMNDELIPTSRWPTVTDEDLINISRSLWNLDHNRIPLQEFFLDPQGQTNKSEKVDRAPNR